MSDATERDRSVESTSATETSERLDESPGSDLSVPFETTPTIRPSLVWLCTILVVGAVATAYVTTNPGQFGGPGPANVLGNVLLAVTALVTVRFAVRIAILTRTKYVVDADGITRRYALLFQSRSRRVPHDMVRSHELSQSRVERIFGYGTIAANQGLGELEFENVPNPRSVYRLFRRQVED